MLFLFFSMSASASPTVVQTSTAMAVQTSKTAAVAPIQQLDTIRPTNGYLILQPQQQDNLVFIPPNQTLSYSSPIANQVMSVVSDELVFCHFDFLILTTFPDAVFSVFHAQHCRYSTFEHSGADLASWPEFQFRPNRLECESIAKLHPARRGLESGHLTKRR